MKFYTKYIFAVLVGMFVALNAQAQLSVTTTAADNIDV
ncbi:MAG: hypothetical protein ACI9XJ_001213, partial [Marivirga sp.]